MREKEANFHKLFLTNMSNGVIDSKLKFKTTKSLNHPFNHKVEYFSFTTLQLCQNSIRLTSNALFCCMVIRLWEKTSQLQLS